MPDPKITGLCVFGKNNSFKFKVIQHTGVSKLLTMIGMLTYIGILYFSALVFSLISNNELSLNIDISGQHRNQLLYKVLLPVSFIYIVISYFMWYFWLFPRELDKIEPIWESEFFLKVFEASEDGINSIGLLVIKDESSNLFKQIEGKLLQDEPFSIENLQLANSQNWKGEFNRSWFQLLIGMNSKRELMPLFPYSIIVEQDTKYSDKSDQRRLRFRSFVDYLNLLLRKYPDLKSHSADYIFEGGSIYSRFRIVSPGRMSPVKNIQGSSFRTDIMDTVISYILQL